MSIWDWLLIAFGAGYWIGMMAALKYGPRSH